MNLNLSSSNYSNLTYNFTLGPLDINNPFGTRAQLGINFSNALLSYSNELRRQERYPRGSFPQIPPSNYSNIITLNNTYDINCNVTGILSELLPDVKYSFNVRVNTNINSNYGILSSNSSLVKTLLPPYPPRLSNVSQCNDGMYYIRNGVPINSRDNVLNILCNSVITQRGGLCNVINNGGPIAILTDSTPGHEGNFSFANITVACQNTDLNIFQLLAWRLTLLNGSSNQTSPLGNSIIRVRTQQQDPYAGNPQLSNFYLQASNVSVIIRDTFLRGSNLPYSYSITHSNNGYSNITRTFSNIYVDNLTQLTSVESLRNVSGNYNGQYITGLFSLSNSQTFNFNLNLLNFASNFLPACNTLVSAQLFFLNKAASEYSNTTSNLSRNTQLFDQSDVEITGAAPRQVRLKLLNWSFSPPNGSIFFTNTVNSQITAKLTIENLVGTSSSDVKIPYYFDTLSLSNLTINHSSSTAIGGARHVSFSNSYCNDFIQFDNSQKIYENSTCNIYNNELPLVEGSYRTGVSIGSRFDSLGSFILPSDSSAYPSNYSELKSETQVRYATFKYSLSNSSNDPLRALEFNMKTAGIFSYIGGINCNFNTNQVPILFYKIDKVGGDSGSPKNTGWLNGNSSLTSEAPLTSSKAGDGSNGLLPNSTNFPITDIRRYWNIISIPASNSYDVYIKIGLQMACNLYFDYMYLASKYLALGTFYSPSNVVFQVITAPTTVRISWSNIFQDEYSIKETRIRISNISNATFPRRFVGAGSRYNDNLVTAVVSYPTNIYDTTLTNADTNYEISLSNISENNDRSSNITLSGRTDLPPYIGTNFYDGNMKFNFFKQDETSTDIYSAFYVGAIPRNQSNNIIKIQGLSIKLVKTNNNNYDPFIINYGNPGPELSNFILYANINNSIASYQFSNGQYINNISNYSNTIINNIEMVFNNAGDMTTGSRDTGFFYKSALNVRTNLTLLSDGINTITLSNNFGNSYPQSFLVDSSTGSPTVNKMFVDTNGLADTAYYTYVSGVLVFRTVTACNYNFWMQTSNLNSKFIMPTPITFALNDNSGKISELSVSGSNVTVYSAANTGSVLNDSFINANNNTFFSWPNVSLNTLSNIGPANTLSLVGRASNLSGESAVVTQQLSTESGGLLYFDNESLITIALTSSSNFINGTPFALSNLGYKVTSGAGLYPAVNTFGELYNHRSNILSGSTYSNELQLANGYFTNSNSVAYLNYIPYYNPITDESYTYPNYRSITTTAGTRWTTFMWYIGTNIVTPPSYASIVFRNHNLTSSALNLNNFRTFTNCSFYYRITTLAGGTTQSSLWLNGNARYTSASLPNTVYMQGNGNNGGLGAGIIAPSTNPNSNLRYILLQGGNVGTTTPYLLHIRLGINNTGPYQYCQYVQLARLGGVPLSPY